MLLAGACTCGLHCVLDVLSVFSVPQERFQATAELLIAPRNMERAYIAAHAHGAEPFGPPCPHAVCNAADRMIREHLILHTLWMKGSS